MHNSTQLIQLVSRYNMFEGLDAHDASPPFLRSYNSERLFTKLDQTDLKNKLEWLMDMVFDRHSGYVLRVRKGMSANWQRCPLPNVRTMCYDEGAKFYTFDRSSAKTLVNFLIDNAFLLVCDDIFRQVKP